MLPTQKMKSSLRARGKPAGMPAWRNVRMLSKAKRQNHPPSKKTLTGRLQLLNGGRGPYLDFLRNLTTQGFLLSLAIVVGSKVDFSRSDGSGSVLLVLCCILVGAAGLAFWANTTLTAERCFSDWFAWLAVTGKALRVRGKKGFRFFFAKLYAIGRYRLIEFLEVFVAFYFVEVALLVVALYAIIMAIPMIHTLGK